MADYSRTRNNLKDIMAFIKSQLLTYTSWQVEEHTIPTVDDLSDYLPYLNIETNPICALMYSGSQGSDEPHRTSSFSIILCINSYTVTDDSVATDLMQDLVDKTLELLDYQPYNTDVWFRYLADIPILMPNYPNLVCAKVDFQAEDH